MARAAADEVKRVAEEAAREAFPKDPAKAIELASYLTQIPATVRQTLRRPDDPTGTTVPLSFALDQPEQLLALLPNRMSEFRPGDPLPGRDGWHLVERLGTGGFGEVWHARQAKLDTLSGAVKFCIGLTDRERTLLYEGELINRVMAAGKAPNVVQPQDAYLTGLTPWLMYEYIPGGDLVGLVDSWRMLAPAVRHVRAFAAFRQIVVAAAHFHTLGVVHRDLKPANVLVNGDTLKVTDFGIGAVAAGRELEAGARAHTSTASRIASLARGAFTPTYAGPQQKKGNSPDPRDDVYALGVIAYQMLVGDVTAERPGGKGWRRGLESQGVRPAVLDVFESCWDDDPKERPRDASKLLARVDRATTVAPLPRLKSPAKPPVPAVVILDDDEERPRSQRKPTTAKGKAEVNETPERKTSFLRFVVRRRTILVLVMLVLACPLYYKWKNEREWAAEREGNANSVPGSFSEQKGPFGPPLTTPKQPDPKQPDLKVWIVGDWELIQGDPTPTKPTRLVIQEVGLLDYKIPDGPTVRGYELKYRIVDNSALEIWASGHTPDDRPRFRVARIGADRVKLTQISGALVVMSSEAKFHFPTTGEWIKTKPPSK